MFDTIDTWITVEVDRITAESVALTSTSSASMTPGAPVNSIDAWAFVLTLLEATIAPPARPVRLGPDPIAMSTVASATFSLPLTAVIRAACTAVTVRSPVAWTFESSS